MMQKLRNLSKGFLIFVAVAFVGTIIFAWGMDIGSGAKARGYIGKINGKEINPTEYQNLVENLTGQLNQNGKIYLDWTKVVDARNQAWDQMVYDVLMNQYINKIGLKVSDRELFEYLWNYPPRTFWAEPSLQTNGQFDVSKYRQLLADKSFSVYLAQIESQEMPRIQRLQWAELLRAGVQISPEELMEEFRNRSEKVKVDYVLVNLSQVRNPEIANDSSEVIKYFNEHQDKYKKEDQAQLDFVSFDVVPSATDSNNTSDLKIWIQEASESADDIFPVMAAVVSDDSRAQSNYGDAGWVPRGRYSPEIDSVVFNLDSGKIAPEPIKTSFGWHIIKSGGKRKAADGTEEVHLYQIVKKIKPSGDTFAEKFTQARQFADEAKKIGFDQTLAKYALKAGNSGLFNKGEYCGRMGQSREANEFAFASKIGATSDAFLIANEQQNTYRFVVACLKETKPAGVMDLKDAFNIADNDLRQQKLMQRAYDVAQRIYEKAMKTPQLDIESVAKDEGAEFITADFFSRSDQRATKLATDPQFMAVAFSMTSTTGLSRPVYTRRGVAILRLMGRQFNPDEFEMQKNAIYAILWAQKVRTLSQVWYDNFSKQSKIEDYRDLRYKWFF